MRDSETPPSREKPTLMHASGALTPDYHPHESRKTPYSNVLANDDNLFGNAAWYGINTTFFALTDDE